MSNEGTVTTSERDCEERRDSETVTPRRTKELIKGEIENKCED